MLINHGAATANVNPSLFCSEKGPLLLFISLRKISMGEEILYDDGPEYHGREGFIQHPFNFLSKIFYLLTRN
jgi:hypothetical protein